jgi:hypothetical protein
MEYALFLMDLALLLLATLRVTRLVTTDNVPGQWWIYGPLYKAGAVRMARERHAPRWYRYLEGLTCPFCVGFWVGLAAVVLVALLGGPGDLPVWFRYLMGAFALNYVVGHVSGRLD